MSEILCPPSELASIVRRQFISPPGTILMQRKQHASRFTRPQGRLAGSVKSEIKLKSTPAIFLVERNWTIINGTRLLPVLFFPSYFLRRFCFSPFCRCRSLCLFLSRSLSSTLVVVNCEKKSEMPKYHLYRARKYYILLQIEWLLFCSNRTTVKSALKNFSLNV